MKVLEKKAAEMPKRIIFPEGTELNILKAASYLAEKGIAKPILIGSPHVIAEIAVDHNVSIEDLTILPPAGEETIQKLGERYVASGGLYSLKGISRRLKDPLYYGAMLLHENAGDAMIAGLSYPTSDVIVAAQTVIRMEKGIETASSFFLMEIPDFQGPEGNLIVFADCGVCVDPDAETLTDIAICTAKSVKKLLDWEPRIALLSFSTTGSAQHESIDKLTQALKNIAQKDANLKVDGELQLDAAIVPSVAQKKLSEKSPVAGDANILIFPDLNAGNITYKAVQRFAKAHAYGPFLQGFSKTVSDLSRGSSVEDIIGAATMAVIHAQ